MGLDGGGGRGSPAVRELRRRAPRNRQAAKAAPSAPAAVAAAAAQRCGPGTALTGKRRGRRLAALGGRALPRHPLRPAASAGTCAGAAARCGSREDVRIFTFRAQEGAQANLTEREYNTYRQPILDECMVMGSPCKDCLGRVGGEVWVGCPCCVSGAYALRTQCTHGACTCARSA